MKKSIILMIGLAFVLSIASLSLVQAKQTTPAKPQGPQYHVFIGTVDSVTLADPVKGTKSEIVVVDKTKKSMTFLIKSTTTFYDAKGNAITLDKIVQGNEVNIRYTTTPEGIHEAASIKILK